MAVLKSMIYAVVAGLLIVFIILVADVIVSSIHVATDYVAAAMNVQPTTHYEDVATSTLAPVFFIGAAVVAGILLVYNIHVKKR